MRRSELVASRRRARALMQLLGHVQPWQDVHHRDHNPLNNAPHNLLALSPERHQRLHRRQRRRRRRR